MNITQIPLRSPIAQSSTGIVTQPWAFYLQQLTEALPPGGYGFVKDGSADYAPMTIYQGPNIDKGSSPKPGSIYLSLDTGDIFIANNGEWEAQTGLLVGDVTKSVNSNVTTLANVNNTPGTWGDTNKIPVFTVNSKGLITSVTTIRVTAPPVEAAGSTGQLQYNLSGALTGAGISFNAEAEQTFLKHLQVGGIITFTTPLPTFNNLSPLRVKGDLLTTDGINNTRLPIGVDDQVLTTDSTAGTSLAWATTSAVFTQATPALTWHITHDLKKRPRVTLLDGAGEEVLADISYLDIAHIDVNFSIPFAGEALLN